MMETNETKETAEAPRILISQNRGETWRPMPKTWRQSGTILEANADLVRQDAGGGREVWYRLDIDEEAQSAPGCQRQRCPLDASHAVGSGR